MQTNHHHKLAKPVCVT